MFIGDVQLVSPQHNAAVRVNGRALMNSTTNATRALCSEHGLPLFYAAGDVFCEHGCDLAWSDLQEDVGMVIEIREGEIFAGEIWVVDLTDASITGETRGYADAAYALAYGGTVTEVPQGDQIPGWVRDDVSDAIRTAYEQGWERGVTLARDDFDAL